jgi:hypothetical protein
MMANGRWPSEWETEPDDSDPLAARPDMLMREAESAAATAFARACSSGSHTDGCDTAWICLENQLMEDAVAQFQAAEEEIDGWTALFIQRGAFSADCALAAAEFRQRYHSALP